MTDRVSIIVPSLGRRQRLVDCITSIISQEFEGDCEIILSIDGKNSEMMCHELTMKFAGRFPIRATASDDRRGSPRAKNDGAKLASGDILIFVDDDVVASQGWLRAIVGAYREGIKGVGGSERKRRSGGIIKRLTDLVHDDATGKVTKSGTVISNFTAGKKEMETVDCLAGANMSFSRIAFESCGGFDEAYEGTAYREETDLCLRIGGDSALVFVPQAEVMHFEDPIGGNSAESARNWNYWYHRNNTYFYLKNLGPSLSNWIAHMTVELTVAIGRSCQQRNLYPLTTMVQGVSDGISALKRRMWRTTE